MSDRLRIFTERLPALRRGPAGRGNLGRGHAEARAAVRAAPEGPPARAAHGGLRRRHPAAARHGAARRRPVARRRRHGARDRRRARARLDGLEPRPAAPRAGGIPLGQPPRRTRDRHGLGALPRRPRLDAHGCAARPGGRSTTTSRSSPRAGAYGNHEHAHGAQSRTAIRIPRTTHEHALPHAHGVIFGGVAAALARSRAMNASTLKLWQLISPALPVGAYSYSQALEYVHFEGVVHDERTARAAGCATCSRTASRRSTCRSWCACIAPGPARDALARAPLEPRARSTARDGRAALRGPRDGQRARAAARRTSARPSRSARLPFASAFAVAAVNWAIAGRRTPAPATPGHGARPKSRPP